MGYEPGEVWFLPRQAEEGGDPKGRRHVLLAPWDDEDGFGIFAYASSQPTEARFGATRLLVDPTTSRSPRTGFTHPTYVYPGRLILAHIRNLLRRTGRLIDEMPQLRACLRQALGLRDSVVQGWHGRVIRLERSVAESLGFEHGVVVTEPEYARHERYQIIVPLLDARDFDPDPGDLLITRGDWLRLIAPGGNGVLAAISIVQSVFHPHEIDGWTGAVVDREAIESIERALAELFEL